VIGTLVAKTLKPKKCRICRSEFTPRSRMQVVCGIDCATKLVALNRQKAEARKLREDKVRAKPRSEWLKLAQTVFNAYIRKRDEHLPCISCGRHHEGQYHAGHYRTVAAAPELRFDELNVHKQCSVCNNHKSGNITEYRINLAHRIGQAGVDYLEGPHEPKKFTVEELQEIIRKYREKIKLL
jgi:Bacteriophage Lambda NinG protein